MIEVWLHLPAVGLFAVLIVTYAFTGILWSWLSFWSPLSPRVRTLTGVVGLYFAPALEFPTERGSAWKRFWVKTREKSTQHEAGKRGKSRGSQAVAQRCLTIAGKYGTSGWFGTARREPR